MVESIPYINSIFEQPWWLEAVAPGKWSVIEIKNGKDIIARMPYVHKRRFWVHLIGVPDYTQTLGIWIKDTGAKKTRALEQQKKCIYEIIGRLPSRTNIDFYLDHTCKYVLPFIWKGFHISVAFSYRLEDISDEQKLWNGLRENIRTDIKKARRTLVIKDDLPLSALFEMQDKTFSRQKRNHKNNRILLERLDVELISRSARKLLCAVDEQQRIHAAGYFVYDEQSCYYLVGGGDPELRNSGATSLLLWEGIRFATTVSKTFDFEGSQIEDIERFFRAFGGEPTPYYHITRLNSVLSFMEYIKPKLKKLMGYKI